MNHVSKGMFIPNNLERDTAVRMPGPDGERRRLGQRGRTRRGVRRRAGDRRRVLTRGRRPVVLDALGPTANTARATAKSSQTHPACPSPNERRAATVRHQVVAAQRKVRPLPLASVRQRWPGRRHLRHGDDRRARLRRLRRAHLPGVGPAHGRGQGGCRTSSPIRWRRHAMQSGPPGRRRSTTTGASSPQVAVRCGRAAARCSPSTLRATHPACTDCGRRRWRWATGWRSGRRGASRSPPTGSSMPCARRAFATKTRSTCRPTTPWPTTSSRAADLCHGLRRPRRRGPLRRRPDRAGQRTGPDEDPDHRRVRLARVPRRDRRLDRRPGRHGVRQRHRGAVRGRPEPLAVPSPSGCRHDAVAEHRREGHSAHHSRCQRQSHRRTPDAKAAGTWPILGADQVVADLGDGYAALRPAVHLLAAPNVDIINVELPFPCVWVSAVVARRRVAPLRNSLVISAITERRQPDRRAGRRADRDQRLSRPPPTHLAAPHIPHEGFLADFLMRNRGSSGPNRLAGPMSRHRAMWTDGHVRDRESRAAGPRRAGTRRGAHRGTHCRVGRPRTVEESDDDDDDDDEDAHPCARHPPRSGAPARRRQEPQRTTGRAATDVSAAVCTHPPSSSTRSAVAQHFRQPSRTRARGPRVVNTDVGGRVRTAVGEYVGAGPHCRTPSWSARPMSLNPRARAGHRRGNRSQRRVHLATAVVRGGDVRDAFGGSGREVRAQAVVARRGIVGSWRQELRTPTHRGRPPVG